MKKIKSKKYLLIISMVLVLIINYFTYRTIYIHNFKKSLNGIIINLGWFGNNYTDYIILDYTNQKQIKRLNYKIEIDKIYKIKDNKIFLRWIYREQNGEWLYKYGLYNISENKLINLGTENFYSLKKDFDINTDIFRDDDSLIFSTNPLKKKLITKDGKYCIFFIKKQSLWNYRKLRLEVYAENLKSKRRLCLFKGASKEYDEGMFDKNEFENIKNSVYDWFIF